MNKLLPLSLFLLFFYSLSLSAQSSSLQKGLLWQISGNGMKKPSYVYGTMHVSQKIAFHLGDSFYIALSKSDVVALEQDLDSVIHRWITEDESENPEDAEKVYPRNNYDFLGLGHFTLNSYNKNLIQRKLSAEVRAVNYLLSRGDGDDFEEDAWLDLYIYQIAKKLGKGFTGVEGYEESRELVRISQKEPKDSRDNKKPRRYNYKLRQQVAEAYRKGDIYMLDSIDRMTESAHYLEYMLYRRNANMVRRMDSIMQLGKTLFTGVGCSHLPGIKGVLQMLIEKGYRVRPVQSIALEKSKMAGKYENMTLKHRYTRNTSDDGLLSALLPTRLTKVSDNSYYSSYLSPDLANGYYYQIEKISCNTVFSGQGPEEILQVIDTLIFENIPGEITQKRNIVSNGFNGIEVITRLKTGDLNRFQILASPFHVYIVRMAGKKDFAASKEANAFFRSLQINEGQVSGWSSVSSPDSVFSLELPGNEKQSRLHAASKADPSFEHLVYDRSSGHTYLIKQQDLLNEYYIEQDSFELNIMARSFARTDLFEIRSSKHFKWQGYQAMDAEFTNKTGHAMYARFVICGTRYLMFVLKPNGQGADFNDRFFSSIRFNGKPQYRYFQYKDSSMHFSVSTPVLPLLTKKETSSYSFFEEDDEENELDAQYKGEFKVMYFRTNNSNEFISVGSYRYGTYENQEKNREEYIKAWKRKGSLLLLSEKKESRKGIDYITYTYTDTNSTRRIKAMHALHGATRYYVEAYLDTVSGNSAFAETFLNTFDVSDTLINDNIFIKKGHRFIRDFSSKDSLLRKAAIRYHEVPVFGRGDIPALCNIIDSISMKGDAADIRSNLIRKLGMTDSAQDLIVPYLEKLYKRFSDTAYLQIEILRAMAMQKSDNAFKTIKPILASDIPISDNAYTMRQMLYAFGDSLKLARIILPELIELTGISEYRNTAYSMLSQMKDSGIITESDYATIHEKLVRETRIEYKRMMAGLTSGNQSDGYSSYDFESYRISAVSSSRMRNGRKSKKEGSYSLLSDILDLSLPLRHKSKDMQEITSKILRITDPDIRLGLLPVLLKYNIDFDDTVYRSLASAPKTRIAFYRVLAEAEKTQKFPKEFMNHHDWIMSDVQSQAGRFDIIDTVAMLGSRKIYIGKDSGLVYICQYKTEDSDEWMLYMSESLPCDTAAFNSPDSPLLFESGSMEINSKTGPVKMADNILFFNLLMQTRIRNGAHPTGMYSGSSYDDIND